MKKHILFTLFLFATISLWAQEFNDYFINKTLRIDYIFTGNSNHQDICLDELSSLPTWAGRRHHLGEFPLEGNGQIIVRDRDSKKIIYATSFSSLFQEWLETDEAKTTNRGFENSFLVPYPIHPIEVEVTLFSSKREKRATLTHVIDPSDILIHQKGITHVTPYKYLLQSGSSEQCIDVAILAEGYTKEEMSTFYEDAKIACESLFSHEPFKSTKDRFNIVAVASPSEDSGVSIPRLKEWKHTAFSSHFSTFYSDRYLTTQRVKDIHDALAGIPYEHIIILANTAEYGGGGIYNSYTLTTAHHPLFRPVVVHEFGHSFGGLADEYYYDNDVMTDTYPLNIEPWEPNITTRINFGQKWEDMMKKNTPIPTPPAKKAVYPVGLYEGGGYSAKGIYRPSEDCRMRTNSCPSFCPVCERAIRKMINFYTE